MVPWGQLSVGSEVDEAGVDEAAGEGAGTRGEVEDFGIGEPMDGDGEPSQLRRVFPAF